MTGTYVNNNRHWLEPYIGELAAALNLAHWRITLIDGDDCDEDLDDCDAAVRCADAYFTADMFVREPKSAAQLRHSIVHELIHIMTRDLRAAFLALEDHLNPPAWHFAEHRFDHELEQAVDAIATAWADRLPLPSWDEEKAAA